VGAAAPGEGAVPAGELLERIRRTGERLTRGGLPEYTREFVVADVALDRRRRFTEFSGDLSGRYLEALAVLPPAGGPELGALVREILSHQRADGRFGDPALRYSTSEITPSHTALLWGNGRLLLGLLEYYARHGGDDVLKAARRNADFLLGVHRLAGDPAIAKRLRGQGAFGIVCFTQLVEPLVLLARATGETRYYGVARELYPALGPRGIQHAHGYLTTLRGMVALAEATRDREVLALVERMYADLVSSPDLCHLGGVLEYFGWETAGVSDEDRKELVSASGHDPRDEGCGVADFLRLSLMLWRATGKGEYLDRAEHCLLNHFFFNQFSTGDFGHHVFFREGIKATESVGRAWWCCTMHGHRAFRDVLDSVVTAEGAAVRINLLQDCDWRGDGFALSLRQRWMSPFESVVTIDVTRGDGRERTLMMRIPPGSRLAQTSGTAGNHGGAASAPAGRYVTLSVGRLGAGDRVETRLLHEPRLETREGRVVAAPGAAGVEGLLFIGPVLYAVDDALEPLFFSEPWKGENVVAVASPGVAAAESPRTLLSEPARHAVTQYFHGGFGGSHRLTLRPIAEQAGVRPGNVATWIRYATRSPATLGQAGRPW
jgi:DUF1680 family protein